MSIGTHPVLSMVRMYTFALNAIIVMNVRLLRPAPTLKILLHGKVIPHIIGILAQPLDAHITIMDMHSMSSPVVNTPLVPLSIGRYVLLAVQRPLKSTTVTATVMVPVTFVGRICLKTVIQ